jgi:hypothetical protein
MADDDKAYDTGGAYTPSTRSAKEYRDDSAALDYANDTYARKGTIASGPTPKRYYDNFDRGAKRNAKRQTKRGSK